MTLFEGMTTRRQVIFLALLLVIATFGFYTYIYTRRAGEIATLSAERVRLQESVKNKTALVSDLARVKRERAELQEKFSKILDRLPEEKEIPRLLRQVATVAGRSGLEVSVFKQKGSADQELYREISVEVATQGGYQNLAAFLNQLSQIPRLLTVGELHAKAVENLDGRGAITTNLITSVFQSHSKDGSSGSPSRPPQTR